MKSKIPQQVKRRRVFYIPGYDPFPPRRYRELYRREGVKQAEITGYSLTMAAQDAGVEGYGWTVQTQIDGHTTDSHVTVLAWADLVQASMQRGVFGAYILLVRTLWIFLSTGAMWAMFRLRPGPMLAGAWPSGMLIGQLLLAILAGWGLGQGVLLVAGPSVGSVAASWVLGLAVTALILKGFRRWDAKLFVYYLLYDFAYTAAHYGTYDPALAARLTEFAAQVRKALEDAEVDEVLVIGHSSGASLAVSVVAEVLAAGVPAAGPALALLTLGEAIPVQSYLPRAQRLRRDLRAVSQSEAITWIDITAKADGVCFGLCDPVAVSGVAPKNQRWPLVISAAFSEALTTETWNRLRRKFFQLHFQYLAAFDAPRDYDYFQITAGPLTLGARYKGRKPSPSRIDRALSPHRSLE